MEDKSQFVLTVGYALIGFATFIVARMLLQEQETRAAQENLEDLRNRKASNPLVKLLRPFFTQYVVPILRGKPFWDNKRKIYRRKLITAGLGDELTSDEFIAFKLILIVFFPIVTGAMRAMDVYDFTWPMILGSGVAGWFYPDLWTSSRITSRQKQIRKAMPFIVDLLALSC